MVKKKRPSKRHQPRGLKILYEDRDILVVDKMAGLLTISTDRDKTRTAYYILTDYVRKGCARSRKRIFIVHRLDRDTSGLLVFAKSSEARTVLQEQWKETKKLYQAVVHGRLEKKEDTITSYLAENRAHVVYSTSDTREGKLAHTAYRVLEEAMDVSLLEISLITGRKNQIRVHLAERGHPIVGDRKYGKKDKGHRRLALHAGSISFKHPTTDKPLTFEAEVPGYFNTLLNKTHPRGKRVPVGPSRPSS